MEAAKKYCETYLHQFMRGIAIPPFKGRGDLLNESELKLHIQKVIKDNNYAVNFDGINMIYTNLKEEFEPDTLETMCCCLPFWRKCEYEKQVALRPWTLKISLRKSNVAPMPMLGRIPLSPLN
jgi:hypothetical protein